MTFDFSPLSGVTLKRGSHELPSEGSCAMEVAALVAGYGWREVKTAEDLPECISRIIGGYVIALNDAMPDKERQSLLPYVMRMGGTKGSDFDEYYRAMTLLHESAVPSLAAALKAVGRREDADHLEASRNVREVYDVARWIKDGIPEPKQPDWMTVKAEAYVYDAVRLMVVATAKLSTPLASFSSVGAFLGMVVSRSSVVIDLKRWPDLRPSAAFQPYVTPTITLIREKPAPFDWAMCLGALDRALKIGPRAGEPETERVAAAVKVLQPAE